jgi:hypothetical protein
MPGTWGAVRAMMSLWGTPSWRSSSTFSQISLGSFSILEVERRGDEFRRDFPDSPLPRLIGSGKCRRVALPALP